MPDDAGIGQQPLHVRLPERRHPVEVEAGEAGTEVLPLAQDGQPGQARLEALKADLLVQPEIVDDRLAPLAVMRGDIVGQVAAPGAADRTSTSLKYSH